MQKMVFGRKLSRSRKAREALFRSQIRALVLSGKIKTTRAKGKAIVGEIDKLVTLAKENVVKNQRIVLGKLGNDRKVANLLFTKIAPSMEKRNSGFTRITNLPQRFGDKAELVIIEWADKIVTSNKKQVTSKRKNIPIKR